MTINPEYPESRSLQQLANEYNFVVFDTSILIPSDRHEVNSREYEEELAEAFSKCQNLITVSEVPDEAYGLFGYNTWLLKRVRNRAVSYYGSKSIEESIMKYLEERGDVKSILKGKYKKGKGQRQTDLELAALAIKVAHYADKTAFVSSDRQLNGFLQRIVDDYTTGVRRGFPCTINELDVYSFIKKRQFFVPFPLDWGH